MSNYNNSQVVSLGALRFNSRCEMARYVFPTDAWEQKRCVQRISNGWSSQAAARGYLIIGCKECDLNFKSTNRGQLFCSEYCRNKNSHAKSHVKARQARWRAKHKKLLNHDSVLRQRDRRKRPEYKPILHRWKAEQRSYLSDGYIKGLLTSSGSLNCANIPHALIELKRAHLKLTRYIKEKSDEKCTAT